MDVKLLLLALTLLNEVWVGYSCSGQGGCKVTVECSVGKGRKRRYTDSTNVTSIEILRRIGTEFSIALEENPCVFVTYDINNDGMITKEELQAKLGTKKETQDLLAFIDTTDGDGMISFTEFCTAIPNLITECKGCCYP